MNMHSLKAAAGAIAVLAGSSALGSNAANSSTTDDSPIAAIGGNYAGTFICALGEMGMSLSITDAGPAPDDALPGSCKTGAGQCNTARAERLASLRSIDGVLNFFPTAGNPDTPAGAFTVSGLAETAGSPTYKIELSPEDWIDRPLGFGSSAMEATIEDGEVTGKPTAPGCTALKMRKIREN